MLSYGGEQVICSVVRDVTERRKAEQAVQEVGEAGRGRISPRAPRQHPPGHRLRPAGDAYPPGDGLRRRPSGTPPTPSGAPSRAYAGRSSSCGWSRRWRVPSSSRWRTSSTSTAAWRAGPARSSSRSGKKCRRGWRGGGRSCASSRRRPRTSGAARARGTPGSRSASRGRRSTPRSATTRARLRPRALPDGRGAPLHAPAGARPRRGGRGAERAGPGHARALPPPAPPAGRRRSPPKTGHLVQKDEAQPKRLQYSSWRAGPPWGARALAASGIRG